MATTADELIATARTYRDLPEPRQRQRIREDAGVSQRAVAEALGVATLTVHRWERGVRPRPYIVAAYLALLNQLAAVNAQ
jgi:DNA-binding transcriptional regulator YiaG